MIDRETTQRTRQARKTRRIAGILLATTAVAGAAVPFVGRDGAPARAAQTAAPSDGGVPMIPASFSGLVETVAPAVVTVASTRPAPRRGDAGEGMPEIPGMPDLPEDAPFREFFERFFDRHGGQGPEGRPRPARAMGSGFIVESDGLIVTNDHVVGEAADVTVLLEDGTEYEAEVVGRDPKTDLAVLRIAPDEPLPTVEWGDSDAADIGDWVVAVGNPFGLGGTVTAGVLSARGRNIGAGPYDDFLQIDAPINRGNSGGPTFNLEGEVIGINTAIFSPSGGSIGIGFAVPSAMARDIVDQLAESGTVERGWLGVSIQTVTDELAGALGLEAARGALVAGVEPGSPAEQAGLRQGDVIVGYDGREVAEMSDLPRLVAETDVGETATLRIRRDGETATLDVEIGRLEPARTARAGDGDSDGAQNDGDGTSREALGARLADLDPQARERFGIAEDVAGVVVADLAADSVLAAEGVRPGDVIVEVDRERVDTPAAVRDAVASARSSARERVLLLIDRQGRQRYVAAPVA